jgi:hypothetical protein
VLFAQLSGVAFARRPHAQEGQGPHPPGLGNRDEEHYANPPQAADHDEVLVARPHRVTIDPLAAIFFPQRLSSVSSMPTTREPSGTNKRHEQSHYDTARCEARPASTAEHPMVAMELLVVLQSRRSQSRADGSLAGREDSTR